MKSPIVNKTKNNNRSTVRNFSAIIAVILAAVTLLQASNVQSNELENREMSMLEMELISEIDQFFAEEEELSLEEEIIVEMEEDADLEISVYDNDNNLLASGSPENNPELRKLMNQADYLSSFGNKDYYRIAK